MRVQHNIMAMAAYRNYTNNVSAMKKNLERLSSGYKINRAGDDAAGLAISEKMRAQITGLETAQKNAKDGISLVQTAEGALTEVHDMLNRMVELATMSANGTYDDDTDRYQLQKELNQLRDEIDRIADSANFNGINLLDGTIGMSKTFQRGDITSYQPPESTVADPIDISGDFASGHGEVAGEGQAPAFAIDLSGLKVKNIASAAASTSVKLNVSFGGVTISATVTGVATGKSATMDQIIDAIMDALNSEAKKTFAKVGTTVASFSGVAMKMTKTANGINFTFFATNSTVSAAQEWSEVTATSIANKINGAMAGAVTISAATTTKAAVTDQDLCKIIAPQDAVISAAAQNFGIDLDLSHLLSGAMSTVDGRQLIVSDGQGNTTTFIFKTDKDSEYEGDNTVVIDLSSLKSSTWATNAAIQAALIMAGGDGISGHAGNEPKTAAGGAFTIGHTGGGVVHFDMTKQAGIDAELTPDDDYQSLKDLFTATEQKPQGTAAHVELTVGTAKDGDILRVDDNTWTLAEGDDVNTVKALLTKAGYKVDQDGDKLTIYSQDKTKTGRAPAILGKGLTLQIGDTADPWNQMNVAIKDCHVSALGIDENAISIDNQEDAQEAIDQIKAAINYVSDVRGTLGATQNRLDHTINNLSVMTENIQDAESTIRDTDIAEEMMAYTKNNILIQASQAMLAQANQVPQGVLQLLQ